MEYGVHTTLAIELSKAKRIIFTRPNGTQIIVCCADDPTKYISCDVNGKSLAYDTDRHKDIWFHQDVCSGISLTTLVGKKECVSLRDFEGKPISNYKELMPTTIKDLNYRVIHEDDDTKGYKIYDGNELVLTANMIKQKKPKRKVDQKDLFNELVLSISKEYTFESPKGRTLIGVNFTDCEFSIPNKYKKCLDHSATRMEVYTLPAFILHDNSLKIQFGFIDGLSGECVGVYGELDGELNAQSKDVLHKYRDRYLETLNDTEQEINKRIG